MTELEKIGRYDVQSLIGSGSVGEIYRVHDADSGQDRALKILKAGVDSALQDFIRRQADYLTSLDHPGLPNCYEYAEIDGRGYLVLDLIDGQDLQQILTETDDHLPVATVIEWGIGICAVVAYLHAQTPPLIVRDIKPINIMVDAQGQVYLIDLGIVEPYQPGETVPKIGTEGYASPEQYEGKSDARTDVYLIGATLHHLLTRRDPRPHPPFTAVDIPVSSLNPAVSSALDALITRALAVEPDARYQTVAELQAALQAVAASTSRV